MLDKACSKGGVQKRRAQKGYSKRGARKGVLIEGTQKGVLNGAVTALGSCGSICRVLVGSDRSVPHGTHGYSHGTHGYCATLPSTRHSFGVLSQSLWDAASSARHCGAPQSRVRAARHCRVLTGYSSVLTRTHTVLRTPPFLSWAKRHTIHGSVWHHPLQRHCACGAT
jgi:hypothetical protein